MSYLQKEARNVESVCLNLYCSLVDYPFQLVCRISACSELELDCQGSLVILARSSTWNLILHLHPTRQHSLLFLQASLCQPDLPTMSCNPHFDKNDESVASVFLDSWSCDLYLIHLSYLCFSVVVAEERTFMGQVKPRTIEFCSNISQIQDLVVRLAQFLLAISLLIVKGRMSTCTWSILVFLATLTWKPETHLCGFWTQTVIFHAEYRTRDRDFKSVEVKHRNWRPIRESMWKELEYTKSDLRSGCPGPISNFLYRLNKSSSAIFVSISEVPNSAAFARKEAADKWELSSSFQNIIAIFSPMLNSLPTVHAYFTYIS